MDPADKMEFVPSAEEAELMRPMMEAYAEVVADTIDATDRGDLDTVQARSMESLIKGMPLCGAFQVLARQHGLDPAGYFMRSPIRPSTTIEAERVSDTGTQLPGWARG